LAGRNTVEIILSARDQASRAVRSAFSSVEGSAKLAMGAIATGAAAAGAAMVTLTGIVGKVGVSYNAMLEQSEVAWAGLLKSQEKAKETIQSLQKMGAKTPFEFEGLDKVARQLEMAGLGGKDLEKRLLALGDAVSYAGKGQEELEGVGTALAQIATKGKISAEEMQQLGERGVDGWGLLAGAMGKTKKEVMKLSSEGKIMAEDVLPKMFVQMEKNYGGAMQKQAGTFNGMMSTLKDNLKMISAEIMKGAFERLKGALDNILPIVDKFLKGLQAGGLKGGLAAIFPASVVKVIDTVSESISGLYALITGDKGKAISIMSRLGLDSSTIQTVVSAVDTIKGYVSKFFDEYLGMAKFELETIKGFFKDAWDFIKGIFSGDNALGESFSKIFSTIKSIVMPILTDAVAFVKEKIAMIKQFWDENGTQIIQAVKNAWAVIAAVFKFIAPVILFVLKMLWDNVKGVIDGALKIIMGIIKVFAGIFTGDFGKMWEGIKQIFLGAIEAVWNLINLLMFGRILGGIKAFVVKSGEFFTGFGTKTLEIFKNLDTYLFEFVGSMVTKIVGVFKGFVDQGVQIFGTLRTFGASIFESLWTAIRTVAGNIASGVKGYFSDMFTGAKFHFDGLLNSARTIFNAVKDAITNPIDTAKTMVGKAIEAIKGAFSGISNIKIPVPHLFFKTGSINPMDWGDSKKRPSFDVKWYDSPRIENSEVTKKNTQLAKILIELFKSKGERPVIV